MISALNISVNAVFRSPLCLISNIRNFTANTHPLYFRATEILLGEPLKKKKRIDPAVVRAREERRRKKLEKKIRSLEKNSGHFKPIYEIDVVPELIKKDGKVPPVVSLSEEEIEERRALEKQWSNFQQEQWRKDLHTIKSIMLSQETALKELKAVSKQLYQKAVEFNDTYLPYNATGPVHTPPISNYNSPDGEYVETTVKYIGE